MNLFLTIFAISSIMSFSFHSYQESKLPEVLESYLKEYSELWNETSSTEGQMHLEYEKYINHDYGFDWKKYLRTWHGSYGQKYQSLDLPSFKVPYLPVIENNRWSLFSFDREQDWREFPQLWVECGNDGDCYSRGKDYCNHNQCMNFEDLIIPCWFDGMCPIRNGIDYECLTDRCLCSNYKGKENGCDELKKDMDEELEDVLFPSE